MTENAKLEFVSSYLRFSNHARLHVGRYGSSHRTDTRVIIVDPAGELAMIVPFDNAEDADLELVSISEQVDGIEAANAAKQATTPGRSARR
jgi:hypothetical protein